MNKRIKLFVVFSISVVSYMGIAQATVYQCKENGKTLFKDKPCEKTEKIVESGSDMATIIANKIKYDKRCTQKLISLTSKHSAKTLSNVEVGRWNGKKSVKAIDQKVICSEQSGLTKDVLSKSIEGEVLANWANMMQWTTLDRHTMRAEWDSRKNINKVTMYRESKDMPSKPKYKEQSLIRKKILERNERYINSTKAFDVIKSTKTKTIKESPQCRDFAAKKWLLDFTVKHGKLTTAQTLEAINNVSYLNKEIKRNCVGSSHVKKINKYANRGVKPDWIKSEINELIDHAAKSIR